MDQRPSISIPTASAERLDVTDLAFLANLDRWVRRNVGNLNSFGGSLRVIQDEVKHIVQSYRGRAKGFVIRHDGDSSPFIECPVDPESGGYVLAKALWPPGWEEKSEDQRSIKVGDDTLFWKDLEGAQFLERYHAHQTPVRVLISEPLELPVLTLFFAVFQIVGDTPLGISPTDVLQQRLLVLHWLIFEPGSSPELIGAAKSNYPLPDGTCEIDTDRLWYLGGIGSCRLNVRRFIEADSKVQEPWYSAVEAAWRATDDGKIGPAKTAAKLRNRHLEVLQALKQLTAISQHKLISAEHIAKRAVGDADPEKVKKTLAELTRWGHVNSLTGRGGGSWITKEGRKYLSEQK